MIMQKNTNKIQQHNKGKIILISLLAVFFIIFSVSAATIGIKIYKTVSSDESETLLNKAFAYVTDEIKKCEDKNAVRTALISGNIPALVIPATSSENKDAEIWFYADSGFLKKTKAKKGSEIPVETGQNIVPMKSADFQMIKSGVLEISFTSLDGLSSVGNFYLVGAGGEGNE